MISKEKLIKLLNGFIEDSSKRTDQDPVMLGSMAGAFAGLIETIDSGELNADESAELTQARAEVEELKSIIKSCSMQLDKFVNDPDGCIEAVCYIRNVNSYLKENQND